MPTTQELTGTRLQERVSRFMGWKVKDWPAEFDLVTMANEAGEWLCGFQWSWLDREPAAIPLTSGQGFLTLPTDFGRHIAIYGQGNTPWTVRVGSMHEVGLARSQIGGNPPGTFVVSYGYSGPSTAGPKSDVRLWVGPIPTQTVTEAFVLVYGAAWNPITDASQHILVPSWLQPLYVRAVCEYVAGYEHDLAGGAEDRLDRLEQSSLFRSAAERDHSVLQDLGPVRGGVEETLALGLDVSPFSSPRSQSIVAGS